MTRDYWRYHLPAPTSAPTLRKGNNRLVLKVEAPIDRCCGQRDAYKKRPSVLCPHLSITFSPLFPSPSWRLNARRREERRYQMPNVLMSHQRLSWNRMPVGGSWTFLGARVPAPNRRQSMVGAGYINPDVDTLRQLMIGSSCLFPRNQSRELWVSTRRKRYRRLEVENYYLAPVSFLLPVATSWSGDRVDTKHQPDPYLLPFSLVWLVLRCLREGD